jgi:hypothetical protein
MLCIIPGEGRLDTAEKCAHDDSEDDGGEGGILRVHEY